MCISCYGKWYSTHGPNAARVKKRAQRRYHRKNPRAKYDYHLRSSYGITIEQYEEMFSQQEGRCGICETTERKLVVDHDHLTKLVRGLICNKCNRALACLGDSREGLLRAIAYLEKGEKE